MGPQDPEAVSEGIKRRGIGGKSSSTNCRLVLTSKLEVCSGLLFSFLSESGFVARVQISSIYKYVVSTLRLYLYN